MVPKIVTQLIADQPRILLVGEPSWLIEHIRQYLSRREIDLEWVNFAEFIEKKESLQSQEWYKCVVTLGWEQSFDIPWFQVTRTFELLSSWQVPVVSLIAAEALPQQTIYSVMDFNKKIDKTAKKLSLIKSISQHLKTGQLLVGWNVIAMNSDRWIPFEYIVSSLKDQILFDVGSDWAIQHQTSFALAVDQILLQPHRPMNVLIEGDSFPSLALVQEIKRVYDRLHKIKTFVQEKKTIWNGREIFNDFIIETRGQKPLPSLLQESIYALPSPESFNSDRVKQTLGHGLALSEPQTLVKPQNENPVVASVSPALSQPTSQPKMSITLDEIKARKDAEAMSLEEFDNENRETKITKNQTAKAKSRVQKETTTTDSSDQEKSTKKSIKEQEIDGKLQSLFSSARTEQKLSRIQKKASTTKKIRIKNTKKRWFFTGGVAAAGAALGLVLLSIIFLFSQTQLQKSVLTAMIEPTVQNVKQLKQSLQWLDYQVNAYSLVIPATFLSDAETLVTTGKELETALEELKELEIKNTSRVLTILGQNTGVSDATVTTSSNAQVYEKLSRAQARLEGTAEQLLDPDQQKAFSEVLKKLEQQREQLVVAQQVEPLIPALIGKNQKRTYALLFQNSQELRPSGGFIQSVAFLTFDSGILVDTQVNSVYELDGKMYGKVDPPPDLEKVLHESQLYLRDSNWNPDFRQASDQITWFLENATGRHIDGVIAINDRVLANILKALGPVELPQFNEVLTDKNLGERLEFHSEVSLVDGASENDYSSVVMREVLQKLQRIAPEKIPNIMTAFYTGLQSKEVLVSLDRPEEQSTLKVLGWTGQLIEPECPAQLSTVPCYVDSLAIVESNVGVNKANYHTNRKDGETIEISQGFAVHTRTINLKNGAQSNAWPKGPYTAYFRFYLPAEAQDVTITQNDEDIPESDQTKLSLFDGRVGYGVVVSTPISQQTTLALKYSVPLGNENDFSYVFFSQKQPGKEQPLSSITLTYDPQYKPQLIAPQAEVHENAITFSPAATDHVFVGTSFSKK